MSDKGKPTTKAKRKAGEKFTVYPSAKSGINSELREKATSKLSLINDFYKPSLVAKALDSTVVADKVEYLDEQGHKLQIDTKDMKQKLADNIDKLKAFYDKQKQKPLAVTTYKLINDKALPKLEKYFSLETIQPNQWTPKTATITKDINGASTVGGEVNVEAKAKEPVTGYLINNKTGLSKALNALNPNEYQEHKDVEIMASPEGNTLEGLKGLFIDLIRLAKDCNINDDGGQVMSIGDIVIIQTHLEFFSIINRTLLEILELNKPVEQTNLFSNTTIGLDIAEITGRHQFFTPMNRGIMRLGESGLYEAIDVAKRRGKDVITIPYDTKGSSSVYRTKLQTSVDISGVDIQLINDPAEAQRFNARLIKTQGILYLWAMYTNSLTIYSTKVSDMLRLAGFKGRIKPEHYIDITKGISGLFGIAITKTDDHYTDPKTGKVIFVGKNEMFGEVVRPIGEVQAVWHMGTDGKPAYIKQLVRLEIAKGMLNPTARRATLVSTALLRLNTLQERQYLQLGSYISDLYSQYQDKTIKGEPVALTLQTLLEYRGLTDPDSLRRVEQTKKYLKQALDKLVNIGHIAKWTVKSGNYEKLTLTGKDLDTVILIHPPRSIQKALKPVINDDDKALTATLKQEVRAKGLVITAEHYGVETEKIQAVIDNRDTADSLPYTAYNKLKANTYDRDKAGKKRRAY